MTDIKQSEKQQLHEKQIKELYLKQKHTLDLFLEKGAISKTQYDKSLSDLKTKMNIQD